MTADTQTKTPKWAANLDEGERNIVQEIIDQCPEIMGFRERFVHVLDKIAGQTPPWKFLFIDEGGDVFGSNNRDLAFRADESEDGTVVIDVTEATYANGDQIVEVDASNWPDIDEDY